MNRPLLLRSWSWLSLRAGLIAVALVGWGWLMPFLYGQFSDLIRDMVTNNPVFEQMSSFGSGNLFTLGGTLTLGTQHPLVIAMLGIFAVGTASTAIAGERQRGTLEVLLARPIPRRVVYVTLFVAIAAVIGALLAALLVGMYAGSATQDLLGDLPARELPLVWLNGFLLWTSFVSFSLAASASFDRTGPAIGLSLAYLLVNYFLEILGSLWTDVAWSQEYSLFHHFQVSEILDGHADPIDFVILSVAVAVPLAWALVAFPRRDLAAPT